MNKKSKVKYYEVRFILSSNQLIEDEITRIFPDIEKHVWKEPRLHQNSEKNKIMSHDLTFDFFDSQ